MVEELRRVAESQRLSNQMSTMQLGPQPPPPPPSQQHQGSQVSHVGALALPGTTGQLMLGSVQVTMSR